MHRFTLIAVLGLPLALAISDQAAAGDAEKGSRLYRACIACHSVKPGRHMTGPSLAKIWNRKAGMVEGFSRYSPAMRNADIVWNEETLDRWLRKPAELIPGNRMIFRGLAKKGDREDLVAYLKSLSAAGGGAPAVAPRGRMAERPMPDLKKLGPDRQVKAISYCRATYDVTTGDGKTIQYWEFNLRFKTDSSDIGPPKGAPALIPASMMGDRAFVIFADPKEISAFIKKGC